MVEIITKQTPYNIDNKKKHIVILLEQFYSHKLNKELYGIDINNNIIHTIDGKQFPFTYYSDCGIISDFPIFDNPVKSCSRCKQPILSEIHQRCLIYWRKRKEIANRIKSNISTMTTVNSNIKLSKAMKKKVILRSLNKTPVVSYALKAAGVNWSTYNRWLERNPKFREDVEAIFQSYIDKSEDVVYEHLYDDKDELKVAMWLLPKLYPEKYGNHKTSNNTEGAEKPPEIKIDYV